MAKKEEKEEKVTFKSILNKVMEKSMNSLISVAAEEAEHIVNWIRNLSGLGKKIRNLLTTVNLFSAGLGVLGIGVALYVKEQFPNMAGGVPHILVGIAIISIAALHSKFSE
jgi:hypothetical protein